MKIAVLIATFKREKETKKCLERLQENQIDCDVYISDSNSNGNIKEVIREFPNIFFQNVGDNVYWNKGMNYSWKYALSRKDYDYFIWLNNDTFLYPDALKTIFNDLKKVDKTSIIVGITEDEEKLTYGGRNKLSHGIVKPSGTPQKIKYMNGNFILVPKDVFLSIGFLNDRFSHSLGDLDYGLRAIKKKINLYASSKVIGFCQDNPNIWYKKKLFIERLRAINKPKGVPLKEYFYFNNTHFGYWKGLRFLLATTIALFSPKLFRKISK